METLIIVVIVVGVVWSLIVGKPEGARFREKYDGWDVYVSSFGDGVIALNRSMGRIVVGTLDVHIERDLSTLASVSAEKDGQGLTTTNRGSQAVGAAVGGLLLGPLGLMIGGVTGSRSHTERVNELALKIVIDDPVLPVHRVVFLKAPGRGWELTSAFVKMAAGELDRFNALLSNSIRAQQGQAPPLSAGEPSLVEDRIAKLWQLREAGALTSMEFDIQKAQLLATPSIAGNAL